MSVRVVRLGTPRDPDEGLRIGTVRRPPRGVRKEDYAARDYFDVWLPELAPSAPLVSWALSEPFNPKRWAAYERRYRREMRQPAANISSHCWLRCRHRQIFLWDATVKTRPAAIGRC